MDGLSVIVCRHFEYEYYLLRLLVRIGVDGSLLGKYTIFSCPTVVTSFTRGMHGKIHHRKPGALRLSAHSST